MNLHYARYLSLDSMKKQKDVVNSQPSVADIQANVREGYLRGRPSHMAISIVMDSNSDMVANGNTPGPQTIENFTQTWADAIHSYGMGVIWRGTWSGIEGLYNFQWKVGGNRYPAGSFGSVVPTVFTDNFNRTTIGANYVLAGTDQGWSITGNRLRGPAGSGWTRTCSTAQSYTNFDAVVKVKKNGNSQFCGRFTDTNFPGYGFQLRTGEFRLEKPGLANLGSVPKSYIEGQDYYVRMNMQGTAIKGKVWKVGDVEPGAWDIEITDSTYTSGKISFAGETSFPEYDDLTITPTADYNSWLGKSYKYIVDHPTWYRDGDVIAFMPERTQGIFSDSTSFISYSGAGVQANYAQFYNDLVDVVAAAGAVIGKKLDVKVANNFSEVPNGWLLQSIFDKQKCVCVDHYGSATNSDWHDSGAHGDNGTPSGTDVYTLTNAINEGATHKQSFTPNNIAYNVAVEFYVVSKGTGDFILTIHDASNNQVKLWDQQTLLPLQDAGQVRIPNSQLVNGAYNRFYLKWDNAWNTSYHMHLHSSDGTGTVRVVTGQSENFERSYMKLYKSRADARAMEIDLRMARAAKGWPIFIQEWSPHWNGGDSLLNRLRYDDSFMQVFSRLTKEGIIIGFNYWGWWDGGTGESILDRPAASQYRANARGEQILKYYQGYDYKANWGEGTLQSNFANNAGIFEMATGHTLPKQGIFKVVIYDKVQYPNPKDDPGKEILRARYTGFGEFYEVEGTRGSFDDAEGTAASAHLAGHTVGVHVTRGALLDHEAKMDEIDRRFNPALKPEFGGTGIDARFLMTTNAPSLTPSTSGGSLIAGTYYYVITALDGNGESLPSPEASGTVASGTTGSIALTWTAIAGAASYRIYRGTASGLYTGYYTATTNSYTDTGAAVTATGVPPTEGTAFYHWFGGSGSSWILNRMGFGTVAPATSSQVEIASTTRGLLIPRMTTTQRDAISSPATGLLIFNTTTGTLDRYNGSWAAIGGPTGSGTNTYLTFWTGSGTISGDSALNWDNTAKSLAIGVSAPDASAKLDITSVTKGLLVPRMTTAQKNAISSPATSLIVFDTDIGNLQIYNGAAWVNVNGKGLYDNGNSGTSKAIDWRNGSKQKVTMNGNCTFTFANPKAGETYTLEFIQDATGSRTITLPTIKWAGGSTPTWTTGANKKDILTLFYDGTDYLGVATLNF